MPMIRIFKSLQDFLSGENADLKRYQLARQLTGIFDQYQILRPDMLGCMAGRRLSPGTDSESWQVPHYGKCHGRDWALTHRGEVWRQVNQKFNSEPPAGILAEILPERISVFGINSMPPLLLAYLQALS